MIFARLVSVSLLLLAVPLYAAESPEATVRAFYKGVYARDAAALQKVSIPGVDVSKLATGGAQDAARLRELEESIGRMQIEPIFPALLRGKEVEAKNGSYPEGTVARYMAALGGNPSVVTLVRQKDGWKVDPRWWLAAMALDGPPEEGTPDYAIKRLLFATAQYDREEAKKWILPGSDVELLFLGAPPQPEPSDVFFALAMEMPLVEMKPGEFVRMPFGRIAEGTSEADRKIYLGMFGMADLPFVVMKRGGAWKVIPQPYYAMMNQ